MDGQARRSLNLLILLRTYPSSCVQKQNFSRAPKAEATGSNPVGCAIISTLIVCWPTTAEWEYAARGGLDGTEFAWGDELAPKGRMLANYWQNACPFANQLLDRWERTSSVGTYPPNGYGLFDMIGNVWECAADWWSLPDDREEEARQCLQRTGQSTWRPQARQPRSRHAGCADRTQGAEERIASLRRQLLPALSPGSTARPGDRLLH